MIWLTILLFMQKVFSASFQESDDEDCMRFFQPKDYIEEVQVDGRTDAILAKYDLNMGIFDLPVEEAVKVLVDRISDPREAAVLYHLNMDVSKAKNVLLPFIDNLVVYLSPRGTVELALDCFGDEMYGATSLFLAFKFTNTLDNRISASHFLYECLVLKAPLQFIKYGLWSLPDAARTTYMYDLVGPEQKPILQILMDQNRADILDIDYELMFCASYYSRSVLKMIENDSVPNSPLFWIKKGTSVDVIDIFIQFNFDFSKKNDQNKSILLHAIEQDLDSTIISMILKAYPEAINDPDNLGIYPLFAAYERQNMDVMSLLVNYGATQAIGFIAKADDKKYDQDTYIVRSTIMHAAVRECDLQVLTLLLSRPDVYKQEVDADFMTPFDLAIQLGNDSAAWAILTFCEKMSPEMARITISKVQSIFKGTNISKSI